jgi:hypothetical protein
MIRPALALFIAFALALPALAQAAPESRYTHYDQRRCAELHPAAAGEEVGDEVGFRCPGLSGVPMWVYYFDSTRLHLGFGRVGNITGTFATDLDDRHWPMEWRGQMRGGRFTPYAVIVRLRQPDRAAPSQLVVWKLTEDGASCVVARIDAGPRQNVMARAAADGLPSRRTPCESEPDRL